MMPSCYLQFNDGVAKIRNPDNKHGWRMNEYGGVIFGYISDIDVIKEITEKEAKELVLDYQKNRNLNEYYKLFGNTKHFDLTINEGGQQ